MTRSRLALILVPLAAAALALSGCQPPTPAPPSESASPERDHASGGARGPVFALPADCGAIASQITLNTVFSGIDDREPGDLVRPSPASASKLLTCSWFTGDTTGGDVIYYSAPKADNIAYLEVVKADGFTCAEALGGTRCDKTTPNSAVPGRHDRERVHPRRRLDLHLDDEHRRGAAASGHRRDGLGGVSRA